MHLGVIMHIIAIQIDGIISISGQWTQWSAILNGHEPRSRMAPAESNENQASRTPGPGARPS